jgi:hypothetical protein
MVHMCGARIDRSTATEAHRIFEQGGQPELAVDRGLFWETGRKLRVRYLGGDPWRWSTVETYASQWAQHANLSFVFGSRDEDPEIRIAFERGRDESWVGKEALKVSPAESTMNLGSVDVEQPERQRRAAILHEFGHALGCIHEHQTEGARIPWNEGKVYAYFRDHYGWSRD